MDKLFVDSNAYIEMGCNFDIQNPIIKAMIRNVKNNKYEYYNISILDKEIASHIEEKCMKDYNLLRKRKWLEKYISDSVLKEKCFKDLDDYNKFKNEMSAINCDVSKINPEVIFDKYFKFYPPFENKKEKKYEFPDAFVSEYINSLLQKNYNDKIYVITKDNGLKKSLNPSIEIYDSLTSFLSFINNIEPYKNEKIKNFIINQLFNIQSKLLEKICLISEDLDTSNFEIGNIEIPNIIDFQVINKEDQKYSVSCKCDTLNLFGNFMFVIVKPYIDNYGELVDIEQDVLELHYLSFRNYEFIIQINEISNNNFSMEFLDGYTLNVDNQVLEDSDDSDYIEGSL